jgi:hypothetical protein
MVPEFGGNSGGFFFFLGAVGCVDFFVGHGRLLGCLCLTIRRAISHGKHYFRTMQNYHVDNPTAMSEGRRMINPTKDDQMQTIQPTEQKALDQIAKFRTRTGMAKTMFGKNAVGDANLIGQLEGGRQLRHEMRKKIKAFIATYKVKK